MNEVGSLLADALDGARLDAFDDEQIRMLYVASHDHLLKAARTLDVATMAAWNERADEYARELKRRFALVPNVYAVAG